MNDPPGTFHQDPARVQCAIREHWDLPEPIAILETLKNGRNSDVWTISAGDGRRYIAKYAYAPGHRTFEVSILAAGHVERSAGIPSGRPILTSRSRATVRLQSAAGREYPLAVLSFVEGRAVAPGNGLSPKDAAKLLATVHRALATYDCKLPNVLEYLRRESVTLAYSDLIYPVIRQAIREADRLPSLTWGISYGNTPEAVETKDAIGLVDWASLSYAPLLWDVERWAELYSSSNDRSEFTAAYVSHGPVPAAELDSLEVISRLRAAENLGFRAFRIRHAERFRRTADHDRDELVRLAQTFGFEIPTMQGK